MKGPNHTIGILVGVTLAVAAPGVFAGSGLSSQPAGQSIVVDGDCTDWDGIELQYFGEGIRTVGLTHDADHLYVMWRYGDERLARRVLARGVTVWVNGDGKKKDVVGVRYPGSEAIAEILPPLEGDQLPAGMDEAGARRMRQELAVREPGFITIIEGEIETDLPEESEDGSAAASAVHDGVFVYEMRIPFVIVGGGVASDKATGDRKIAVGFQIGGLSPAEQEAMNKEMRERRLADSTGDGLAGRAGTQRGNDPGVAVSGGGVGSPPGREYRKMSREIEWLKVKLLPAK